MARGEEQFARAQFGSSRMARSNSSSSLIAYSVLLFGKKKERGKNPLCRVSTKIKRGINVLWDVVNWKASRHTTHAIFEEISREGTRGFSARVSRQPGISTSRRIFRYSMQLKAEEFCILITSRPRFWPASSEGGEDRPRTCTYVYICVCVYNVGFSRRDFDLQAGEYFIIGGIMQRFGISGEGEDLRSKGGWIRENGVSASFHRSVNFLIEKLALLVGKFPVGTVYARKLFLAFMDRFGLSSHQNFWIMIVIDIKLKYVITVSKE